MPTVDISVVRSRAMARGSHFFDRDTMRFFNSRVERTAYQHGSVIFFITSEKGSHQNSRLWSIRVMKKDGDIDTVGSFQQYRSLNEAKIALKMIIKNSTRKAEIGYHGMVRKPRMFMIGEAGPERVNITPVKSGKRKSHNNSLSIGHVDLGNIKIRKFI